MDSGVPHEMAFARRFGRSPGNGTTEIPLSRGPLATEGEATPGPDDVNPFEEQEQAAEAAAFNRTTDPDPTAGEDPFAFDDIGDGVGEVELPSVDPPKPDMDFDLDFGGW